jgi:hypothetical protein
MTCHVAVTTDGRTELLKEATISNRRIETGRRNRKHKREIIRLNTIQWIYPRWILEVSTLDGANEWAGGLLRFAMMTNASTLEKIIVRVTKAGCTAAFGIDLARGKYFFSDRDDSILAADGKKKRIFHAVRSHLRQLPTGEITVRDHYRGLRHFDWNGYAINIVLPHLNRIMEFDKPSIYTEDLSKEEIVSYVDQQVVGEKFAEVLSS